MYNFFGDNSMVSIGFYFKLKGRLPVTVPSLRGTAKIKQVHILVNVSCHTEKKELKLF